MSIKERITADLKDAMRARDQNKITTLRLITAAIKQIEVDQRIAVEDDAQILVILDKMVKQRKESITQFEAAKRDDLVAQEKYEMDILTHYLPEQLSDSDVENMVTETLTALNAEKISDMGKVMAALKPKLQGRADMAKVSEMIKSKLS